MGAGGSSAKPQPKASNPPSGQRYKAEKQAALPAGPAGGREGAARHGSLQKAGPPLDNPPPPQKQPAPLPPQQAPVRQQPAQKAKPIGISVSVVGSSDKRKQDAKLSVHEADLSALGRQPSVAESTGSSKGSLQEKSSSSDTLQRKQSTDPLAQTTSSNSSSLDGRPTRLKQGGVASRLCSPAKDARTTTPPDIDAFVSATQASSPIDSFALSRGLTPPLPSTPGTLSPSSSMRRKARTPPSNVSGDWWEKIDAVKKATKRAKGATIDEKLRDIRSRVEAKGGTRKLSVGSMDNVVVDLVTQCDPHSGGEYTEEDYQYAEWLGMDIVAHPHLMYIARAGLSSPVPDPWVATTTPAGDVMYHNRVTKESSEDHPFDTYYNQLYAACVRGETFMSVEEYILTVLRPADVSSQPIIITNSSVQFTDVTTKYVIKMHASPDGLRYTVSGGDRPRVRKVTYDAKTKMLKFPDLNKGTTLPRNCPEKLVAAIKRLCDVSGVVHNFPSSLTFTTVPAPDKSKERPFDRTMTPLHPTERKLRKTRRKEQGVVSPDHTPVASPLFPVQSSLAQSPQAPELATSSSSLGPSGSTGTGGSSDDELFRECLRRVEASGVSKNEFLQAGNFTDKEVDELLVELKFGVTQRYKIKARLDLLRMERIADHKNAELERQMEQAQTQEADDAADCDDEEDEELTPEAIENSEILERLGAANVPEEFLCTITGEIMRDPTCTCDGHVYEKSAITAWLFSHDTSPNTNKLLDNKSLIPNIALRKAIQSWRVTVLPQDEPEPDPEEEPGAQEE